MEESGREAVQEVEDGGSHHQCEGDLQIVETQGIERGQTPADQIREGEYVGYGEESYIHGPIILSGIHPAFSMQR